MRTSEAAAAIIALINSKPRSPRIEEVEAILSRIGPTALQEAPASDIRIRLRKAMARHDESLEWASKLKPGPELACAEAELDNWAEEIAALEAVIPHPPTCF